jgi:transposase-like protein
MAAKKSRPRTKQREAARTLEKLQTARERLFELEPGGSPERPLSVTSAAVVETQAESVPCPRCEGKHDVAEHVAVTVHGTRLREARLRCRQCGSTRSLWFRITDALPN